MEENNDFLNSDLLYCPVCKRQLTKDNFSKANRSKTGYRWCCKECYSKKPENLSDSAYRNRYDEEYHNKTLESKHKEFRKNIVNYIYNRTKNRAKEKGLEFSIDIEDIKIPEICPILEVPIVIGTKDSYEYSPSIDRIDNSKGYIKGNIQIISKKANSMKNSATPEELRNFCKNILRYSLNNDEKKSLK